MDSQPVPVAFVGGVGRSGSTLLCRMLHRLPTCVHVGEISYLWRHGVQGNLPCSCGAAFLDCSFWTSVGQAAFGGWAEVDAARAESLRRGLGARNELFRVAAGRGSSRPEDLAEYADLTLAVFRAVREVSGSAVVVDNSKLASEAHLRMQTEGLDTRIVHLVRDSRGVAYSRSKQVPRQDIDNRQMGRHPPGRTAARWVLYNFLLEAISRRGAQRSLLRYEDFVAAPEAQFRRVVDFLGIEATEADFAFVHGNEVDLIGDHGIWGNPMRLRSGPQTIRLDEAWQQQMRRGTKLRVTALSLPGMLRYHYLGSAGRAPAVATSRLPNS
ncbi:MAG: sulfotransferase [Geodermatophilaceae bacterium]|nr:sulfotransferase [Geodermatophilaceae bacterium]